ncbi:lysozyme [bacterium]|nr:lysozyme [bacterium]
MGMEIRKIIREEIEDFSDFEWAKGEIEYPIYSIDFLIGKKAYIRENNMDEVQQAMGNCRYSELDKSDLTFGEIRSEIGWTIKKSNIPNTVTIVLDKKKGTQIWDIDDVLELVRLGIWVVEGDDGKFINESEEFDWIKDINPELTNENFHMFYNKPFYWYHKGEPVSDWGIPRVFWFEESGIHVRDKDEIALMCHKDVNDKTTSEPKDECTDIFHSTAIRYIKKGTLQHQPQLSDIKECENYLDKILNNVTLINEDGRKPDMEWDFTKNNLDKSKKWVKTKEDVKKYLSLLFSKLKNLPRKIKVKIIKYVLISFIGLLTVNQLQTVVDEVSPEKIEITKIQQTEKEEPKEEPKVESIRKPSEELFTFLKKEEGYVGKGYKIGDGKITIGWGHAEDINNSKYKLGQEIDTTEAKILLKQDVKKASEALNRILNNWESKGIEVNVTQEMYNTMTSMIFNMGIGNFRKSDFIQLVKKNRLDKAKEKIKTTSSHLFSEFPGLKKRRELESGNFNTTSS